MQIRLSRMALVFVVTFVTGLGTMAYLQDRLDARYWPLGVDVYLRWAGARALWQGESPYSPQVTAQTDQLIGARVGFSNQVTFDFYDPAYSVVAMLPLALLPADAASVLWCSAMFAALVTLGVLWSWGLRPRPRPLLWGALLLSVIFFRPALVAVINGQFALFVIACGALAWWLIARESDAWAGALLALCTIKPSIGLFAVLMLVLWAARWQRWKLIAGFVATMLGLVGFATFKIGWWIPDFIERVSTYSQVNRGAALAWSMADVATLPGLVWLVAALVLLAIGVARLWHARDFPWFAVIAALNLNLMFTPHLVEYDLAILLVPLVWLGTQWAQLRWGLPAWILLVWVPWLSWLAMFSAGLDSETWWKAIWQMYPSLLIGVMLMWLARDRLHFSFADFRPFHS